VKPIPFTVGSGKVEKQPQVSHFPTAPTACGARKEIVAWSWRHFPVQEKPLQAISRFPTVSGGGPGGQITSLGGKRRTNLPTPRGTIEGDRLVVMLEAIPDSRTIP
jgi:hypothetical protein